MSQPKTPAVTAAKIRAKRPSASSGAAAEDLTPSKPKDYTPQGDVIVLSERDGVRVVSDDVRVWKELSE